MGFEVGPFQCAHCSVVSRETQSTRQDPQHLGAATAGQQALELCRSSDRDTVLQCCTVPSIVTSCLICAKFASIVIRLWLRVSWSLYPFIDVMKTCRRALLTIWCQHQQPNSQLQNCKGLLLPQHRIGFSVIHKIPYSNFNRV